MAWAATAAAAGSVIAGGLSMSSGKKAAEEAGKDAAIRRNMQNSAYSPINIFGPGGMGVTFGGGTTGGFAGTGGGTSGEPVLGPDGQPVPERGTLVYNGSKGPMYADGQGGRMTAEGLEVVPGTRGKVKRSNIGEINIGVGDLEGVRAGLVGAAGGQMDQFNALGNLTSDPFMQSAFSQFLQAGQNGIGGLQQGAGQMFQNTLGQATDAFGFANNLTSQAQGVFGALPGTQEAARDQQLALLREQARPEEERAFSNLQDNLFATGRMGSSGGGLMMEAFAKGLGQADLSRQLAAGQEGRNAQTAQMQMGTGLQGLSDALLNSATGRFGQVSNLAQGLQQQGYDQSLTTMNNIFNPLLQQQQLQGGALANLAGLLQGQQSIVGQGMDMANLTRAFMGDQAATRTGASAIGTPVDTSQSTALAQLSGALMPSGGIGSVVDAWRNRPSGGGGTMNTSTTLGTGADYYNPILQ